MDFLQGLYLYAANMLLVVFSSLVSPLNDLHLYFHTRQYISLSACLQPSPSQSLLFPCYFGHFPHGILVFEISSYFGPKTR